MRRFVMTLVTVSAACARTLTLTNSPCPCESGFQCCNGVCITADSVCNSGETTSPLTCSLPGDATVACTDGGVCGAGFPCLTSVSLSSDGACCAGDACSTTQRLTVDMLQRTAPIVVDGDESDWTAAQRHPITRSTLTPESASDLSANFSVAWDATAIYLLVEVIDDVFVPADSGPDYPYWDDGIEIFLDIAPTGPDVANRDGVAHYFVNSTETLYQDLGESPQGWVANINLQHVDSLHRWWIEMSLAWPPGFAPGAGTVLGFDLAVNDVDTVDTSPRDDREGQLFWNDGSGTAANNPGLLGTARLIGCPDGATSETPLPTPAALQKYTDLIFDDEFEGALDTSKWTPSYWYDTGGGGMATYATSQVETVDGTLRIRTELSNGAAPTPYLTGIATTHDGFQFLYGVYEARMRANVAPGVLSAVWAMNAVAWPPDIDLVDTPNDHTAAMTVDYDNSGTPASDSDSWVDTPDLSADFHTYTLAWTPASIDWYIDGVQRRATYTDTTHIPNVPFFLILSTHVGSPGDWQGTPDATTPMPNDYTIDYVRVWQ